MANRKGLQMRKINVVSAVFLLLVFSNQALCDYIPPGSVSVQTTSYHPGKANLRQGTYRYAVSWQGIPVVKAKVVVSRSGIATLKVDAFAQTVSGIRWLYSLKHQTTSIFHESSLRPVNLVVDQTENKRSRRREVNFLEDGSVSTALWKNGKKEGENTFLPKNEMFDPISAAFLARTLPIEVGKQFSFDVYNGKHRYLITFTVEDREFLDVHGVSQKAFRVSPAVKKLTDSEGEKKLQHARLWISDDDNRDVLRLESKVWIGKITAQLIDFTPDEEVVDSGTLRARLEESQAKKPQREQIPEIASP